MVLAKLMLLDASPTRAVNITCFNGIDLFSDQGQSWIESRTGEKVNLETLCALQLPWANTHRLYMESSIPELPSRLVVDNYVEIYCSSAHILVFPVISKSLFTKTLDLAYGSNRVASSASAKSCVYAFLSVVTLFGFDDDMHGAMDCGSYAAAAQSFMAQITQEMTLDGLQSLIMLVSVSFAVCSEAETVLTEVRSNSNTF